MTDNKPQVWLVAEVVKDPASAVGRNAMVVVRPATLTPEGRPTWFVGGDEPLADFEASMYVWERCEPQDYLTPRYKNVYEITISRADAIAAVLRRIERGMTKQYETDGPPRSAGQWVLRLARSMKVAGVAIYDPATGTAARYTNGSAASNFDTLVWQAQRWVDRKDNVQ